MESIAQHSQSRQQFLNTLITTGAGILLSCSRREHLATNAEVLQICREGLPRLWSLYFEGDFVTVEHALPIYMLQLTLLAKTNFAGQREAQQLVADAHMLASLLATQSAHFGQAQTEARCALVFARAANDHKRMARDNLKRERAPAGSRRGVHRYGRVCRRRVQPPLTHHIFACSW